MDCSVVPLKQKGLSMVSTTDYFYPLVDDPYMQGRIACANVLSDLYAMGVVDCDNMLMLLASSTEMSSQDAYLTNKLLIEGFNDLALEAETQVTGGQTVRNPWPIIGGVATSICREEEFIMPVNAVAGDVIVLTKPLGIQVAVNLSQWRYNERWERVEGLVTKEEAGKAYEKAMYSMARLNRNGARLMHKYQAHAATDITGFGIFGHSRNLAGNQKGNVRFEIHTLPIIQHMKEVDDKVKTFDLMNGKAAETSGGLFVCLPQENAESFCKEIESLDGYPAWIIGNVLKAEDETVRNTCKILPDPIVINY